MSPSSFEERSFMSLRAIMEHSAHAGHALDDSTSHSGDAHEEHSVVPPRSLANTSASLLSSCMPNGHQPPPAPPQSVQSAPVTQSEPDLHSANDRLIENPRNSPSSSIQGRGSISLTTIDKRLEAFRLTRGTASQAATSTEVLDVESERGFEFSSSSPIQEMTRRRKSEIMSSDRPALQSNDGVLEHGDWKDEIISAVDQALARLAQLAHDDHVRNPGLSVQSHFTQHLTASLNRKRLPFPDNAGLQHQLEEQTRLYNEQVKVSQDLAKAVADMAKASNEQAKTVSKLASCIPNAKEQIND